MLKIIETVFMLYIRKKLFFVLFETTISFYFSKNTTKTVNILYKNFEMWTTTTTIKNNCNNNKNILSFFVHLLTIQIQEREWHFLKKSNYTTLQVDHPCE